MATGAGGDPVMTALDLTQFEFTGVPHRLHKLYSRGPLQILARLTPVGWTEGGPEPEEGADQYISGFDVIVGDLKVVVESDGTVAFLLPDYHFIAEIKCDTIDAPGHPGSTSDEPHPLQGVPHCNIVMPIRPAHRLGESGIWVDGAKSALYPGDYVVPG